MASEQFGNTAREVQVTSHINNATFDVIEKNESSGEKEASEKDTEIVNIVPAIISEEEKYLKNRGFILGESENEECEDSRNDVTSAVIEKEASKEGYNEDNVASAREEKGNKSSDVSNSFISLVIGEEPNNYGIIPGPQKEGEISKLTEPLELQIPRITSQVDAINGEMSKIDSCSVYVGNVDYGTTKHELEEHFNDCGAIKRITILRNQPDGQPKGCAYIQFVLEDSVKAAIDKDGSLIRGRQIKVTKKWVNLSGLVTVYRGSRGVQSSVSDFQATSSDSQASRSGIQTDSYQNMQSGGYNGFQTIYYSGFKPSGQRDFHTNCYSGFRPSSYDGFRTSCYPGFQPSAYRDGQASCFQPSGYNSFQTSGYSGSQLSCYNGYHPNGIRDDQALVYRNIDGGGNGNFQDGGYGNIQAGYHHGDFQTAGHGNFQTSYFGDFQTNGYGLNQARVYGHDLVIGYGHNQASGYNDIPTGNIGVNQAGYYSNNQTGNIIPTSGLGSTQFNGYNGMVGSGYSNTPADGYKDNSDVRARHGVENIDNDFKNINIGSLDSSHSEDGSSCFDVNTSCSGENFPKLQVAGSILSADSSSFDDNKRQPRRDHLKPKRGVFLSRPWPRL